MVRVEITEDRLAELLDEAADAHHIYEQDQGEADPQWHHWYARFILERLQERQG